MLPGKFQNPLGREVGSWQLETMAMRQPLHLEPIGCARQYVYLISALTYPRATAVTVFAGEDTEAR